MASLKRAREVTNSSGSKRVKTEAVQTKLPFCAIRRTPLPTGQFPGKEVKVACWNVNGLRACVEKDVFWKFAEREDLDILCLNEHKLQETHVDEMKGRLKSVFSYQYYACSVHKKGYSGVAILSNTEPVRVDAGLGVAELDQEGRVLCAEFASFLLLVVYTPNSGAELSRLDYRIATWDPAFCAYIQTLLQRHKPLVCVGDFNVVHQALDICEADRSIDSIPGTTPQEKDSFSRLLRENSLIDSFRHRSPAISQFSWFANETTWRKGLGWRLDYGLISADLLSALTDSRIHDTVRASDHCPIELVFANSP